jgi:Glycosyl hydrolases family 2, sugar binding domain/Glycosyl hydrolases family 2/Glycosyl hydrolases family 2, TIM barrel domain
MIWKPVPGHIMTKWAAEVDPACPLPEYPRPQMTRPLWVNLNGLWDYAIVPKEQMTVGKFEGQILVPFAVESALSGVKRPLLPSQRLWYRRYFRSPLPVGEGLGVRSLLHFGAVDWETEVFINGQKAGEHRGGYLPFTFDITELLQEGENELVVSVWDPSDRGRQECGKQSLKPKAIWYTAVSGIWQTVWLERVPEVSLESLRLTPDLDAGTLSVEVKLRGAADGVRVEACVFDAGIEIVKGMNPADASPEEKRSGEGCLLLSIPNPKPWSPESPHLYDLKVRLIRDGQILDEVGSYFAMRKFSLARDRHGHLRFHLNNQPLFLYGPLDQGYFPDGLYTAPTEAAMLYDIEYTRAIGCNFIRKHVKVEPARWYTACDRLGMIVWQDMPNGGKPVSDVTTVLAMLAGMKRDDKRWLGRFGRGDAANRRQFHSELEEMITHLYNAPCIAAWVPFNEGWGQFEAAEAARIVRALDSTRLVDHASGWFDQGKGDFVSIHMYFRKLSAPKKDGFRAFAMSEFGGYSLLLPGHAWDEKKKFGYRFYKSREALTDAYLALLDKELAPLIPQGLAVAVYTQTTDVEIEINGYLTYDRAVEKMDGDKIREAHEKLYDKFKKQVS